MQGNARLTVINTPRYLLDVIARYTGNLSYFSRGISELGECFSRIVLLHDIGTHFAW